MFRLRYLKDKFFIISVGSLSILIIAPFIHIILVIFYRGLSVLISRGPLFLLEPPPSPLSRELGGIGPAFIGSLYITLISLPITVALSLFTAILENEFPRNPFSRAVDLLSRSLASVPTILVSMVVYTTLVVPMKRFSALAGAVALVIVSIPFAYTSFSTAIRSVPRTYREAAYSIGMNRWKTVFLVFIPIAKRGLVASVLIAFARACGETAALFFTIGRNRSRIDLNIMSPSDSIPLLIFDFITSPFKIFHEVAWGATLVLFIMYLAVFIAVKSFVKEVKL